MRNASTIRSVVRAWRSLAPANTLHLLMLHAAFAAVIVASFVYTRESPPPAQMSISLGGTGGAPAPGMVGAGLTIDPDELVAKFPDTRIGQVVYAPKAGDRCRRMLFDNNAGSLYETSQFNCVQPPPDASTSATVDRLQSVRKTFQTK